MDKITTPEGLEIVRKSIQKGKDPKKQVISICGGTGCKTSKSDDIIEAFKEGITKQKLQNKVDIRITGCHGFCEKGPMVVIYPRKIFYPKVKPKDVSRIITETVVKNGIIKDMLYVDPNTNEKISYEDDIPFYKKQTRILFGKNSQIDPTNIDDYISIGGYSALSKVLTHMTEEEVIDEINASELRGRGGAGFPTGSKWEFARKAPGDIKYVVANGHEGDPGAFTDRHLMEANPHSVIEGLIICAYAIGAHEGVLYVCHKFPQALKNLDIALKQAREYGFLGPAILGKKFDFDLKIVQGSGTFVCGEETAVLSNIEGRIGEPRPRPPYPAQSGLWGKPTNVNNVKTLAIVPQIINNGAKWYTNIGAKNGKGTQLFSLAGDINNIGIVEVPIGIPLRELIYEVGGGISNGKQLKAVMIGGPSGGCVPNQHVDVLVDYNELAKVGSMMGSGEMVVMDEDTCMVDVARYFLSFLSDESCGRCTSCREGNARMLEILEDICKGKGHEDYLGLLDELSEYVKETSICGLGKTAPNPVLTTLKYFKDEYLSHIQNKECPAKVCKELIFYTINTENCTGCTLCALKCPVNAISGEKKKPHAINKDICTKCGTCFEICKFNSVNIKTGGT